MRLNRLCAVLTVVFTVYGFFQSHLVHVSVPSNSGFEWQAFPDAALIPPRVLYEDPLDAYLHGVRPGTAREPEIDAAPGVAAPRTSMTNQNRMADTESNSGAASSAGAKSSFTSETSASGKVSGPGQSADQTMLVSRGAATKQPQTKISEPGAPNKNFAMADPLQPWIPTTLESSFDCRGTDVNRSCVFRNLYWVGGQWQLFLVRSPAKNLREVPMLSTASKYGPLFHPVLRYFEDLDELYSHVSSGSFARWRNLTAIFDVMWHHNIGHALFDGLYPAFLALLKFELHNVPFHAVLGIEKQGVRHMVEDILDAFAGLGTTRLYELQKKGSPVHMEVAVAGSRSMGQRYMNADVSLAGGRDMDGSRLFRNRMYVMHKIPLEPAVSKEMMQVIIIQNRRFSQDEQSLFRGIREADGMKVEYIDWTHFPTFASQLQKLRSVAVHVSSIGTGQMYQTFLLDGSIHVNLGALVDERQSQIPMFMEQYMAEGAPYLRALYYNSSKRLCGLHRDEVMALLKKAVHLYRRGFNIPVPPGENLSPEGRVFRKLCADGRCEDILKSMNPGFGRAYSPLCAADAWVEFVVYEQGGWSPNGWPIHGTDAHCPLDRAYLHEIRRTSNLAPLLPPRGHAECIDGMPRRIVGPANADPFQCSCSNTDTNSIVTWARARHQCFEIALPGTAFRLAVRDQSAQWPDNGIFAAPTEAKPVQFRIVNASSIDQRSRGGFALESCTHERHYLRHMNGHIMVGTGPPGDPDSGWTLPSASLESSCGMLRAAISHDLGLELSVHGGKLERSRGTCIDLVRPSSAALVT